MSDPFKELRAFKPPLWSRLLGWWRARRAAKLDRKKVHHITTVTLWQTSPRTNYPSWLHLYETGAGERSFEYQKGNIPADPKTWACYNTVIVPWLHGKTTNKAIAEWAEKTHKSPVT